MDKANVSIPAIQKADVVETIEFLLTAACNIDEALDTSMAINANERATRVLTKCNILLHSIIDDLCVMDEKLEDRVELERIYLGLPKDEDEDAEG